MISKKTEQQAEQQRLRAAARDHSLQKTKIQRELPLIVQELCESRGGRPGLSVLTSLLVSVERIIEPCFGIGHNLSLICQLTSEDIKHQFISELPLSNTQGSRRDQEEGGGAGPLS